MTSGRYGLEPKTELIERYPSMQVMVGKEILHRCYCRVYQMHNAREEPRLLHVPIKFYNNFDKEEISRDIQNPRESSVCW